MGVDKSQQKPWQQQQQQMQQKAEEKKTPTPMAEADAEKEDADAVEGGGPAICGGKKIGLHRMRRLNLHHPRQHQRCCETYGD